MKRTFLCLSFCIAFISAFWGSASVHAGGIPEGPNVQITDTGLDGNDSEDPHLTIRGDTVYAVWRDDRPNRYRAEMIYFAKSTDGGATWGAKRPRQRAALRRLDRNAADCRAAQRDYLGSLAHLL